VKLCSILLRSGCILPDGVEPPGVSFGNNWMRLEEIQAPAFDAMIREAGWHFMMLGSCSRTGCGLTEEKATQRALAHALEAVTRRFNAAEFESLRIARYPGFYIAAVTMRAHHIQQNASLDTAV
jgi:hypothetical protein